MARRLFNILCCLSLLFLLVVAALWALSFWVGMGATAGPQWYARTEVNTFCIYHLRTADPGPSPGISFNYWHLSLVEYASFGWHPLSPRHSSSFWNYLGFTAGRGGTALGTPIDAYGIPFWFPCLLAGALPIGWILRRRHQRHRGPLGLCLQCGYDLRATPRRCPECGTLVPQNPPEPPPSV